MKLFICGDTSPICVNNEIENNDIKTLFNDVADVLRSGDRVIANIECALTDSDFPIKKKGPNLKAPIKSAEIFKKVGITDCSISNNHIFDYGVIGVNDTLNAFAQNGLNYTGFGQNAEDARKNLVIEKNGVKVAIIAVCEHEYCYALEDRMGARAYEAYDTIEDIVKAKKENDYVIILYHGGKEQSVYPSPRLRKVGRTMVKHGADVVLCQHSHCIGCYEEYENGHILYGQGNFHFIEEGNDHPHWQNGFIVEIDIEKELNIKFIPVSVKGNGIELSKGNDYEQIMKTFKEQNDNLNNGKWIDGWREFCRENSWYYNIIKDAYTEDAGEDGKETFAHFLRCEAHLDVWEELCKLPWETEDRIHSEIVKP